MDIGAWLRSLGLERYESAFRENEITEKVLPRLTAEDLKDLSPLFDIAVSFSTQSQTYARARRWCAGAAATISC